MSSHGVANDTLGVGIHHRSQVKPSLSCGYKGDIRDAWGVMGTSGGPTVTVRLRFAPEAAYRLREGGYPNLTIDAEEPDGSVCSQVSMRSPLKYLHPAEGRPRPCCDRGTVSRLL
jgi:hypothetical protein